MLKNNIKKNINSFWLWLFPIIIASKIVRWTLMYAKLVAMSIGNGIVERMALNQYQGPIQMTVFSDSSTGGVGAAEYNTGVLFSALNFFGIQTTIGWEIYITIFFNIFIIYNVIDFYKRTPTASTKENIFIYLGIAILNIFCFNLAKEPYQMLFFFLMAYAIKKGKGFQQKSIFLGAAIATTVIFARKYYALLLIYYVALYLIVRHLFENIDFSTKQGRKKLLLSSIFSAIVMGSFYWLIVTYSSMSNEDTYTQLVQANYRATFSNLVSDSEIFPIFSSANPFLMAMDYTIKIFRLLFPIELLFRGKVTYLFLIGFQTLLIYFIARAFSTNKKLAQEKLAMAQDYEEEEEEDLEDRNAVIRYWDTTNPEEDSEEEGDDEEDYDVAFDDSRQTDRRHIRTCALYLYLSFLLCSACFEPDFGSWIRHQGVVFPVFILIL